ncbi:MAG: hypothetical protein JSS20_06940 [Proteobacteria bacterium]|nr:hypothetical protein [Pseudomonadota bacterium]
MRFALKVLAPAAVIAAGLAFGTAQAAPVGNGLAPLKSITAGSSTVEKAYWHRRCWWHHGHRYCRRYWH